MSRPARGVALLLGAIAAGVALIIAIDSDDPPERVAPDLPGSVPADALWVSPDGSDTNPGTKARPWRTLERAVSSLAPGDTVVLADGTYGARGTTLTLDRDGSDTAPITVRGDPDGPRPTVLGAVRIRASYLRLDHLLFDGPTGPVLPASDENPRGEQIQVALDDDEETLRDVSISDCEVRDSDWHAGIFVAHGEDVSLIRNHIHDNGDENDPAQANLSHGIYWDSGSGLVANNVIEGNVARGVQLYPEPSGVVVTHNTIVGNGRAGVQVGNDASSNVIVNNILVGNGDHAIRASSLTGTGNVARANLAWDNVGGAGQTEDGLTISDTIEAPPGFADGFGLLPDSPAVDAAVETGTIGFDHLGRRRPRGESSDLGAYESE